LPVPVRVEVSGLLTALSITCNVPVVTPVCVGVKTTLIVHLDLAAKLDEQVVAETLNSPVVEALMPVSATACRLLSVNVFATLVAPTAVFANVAAIGVSLSCTPPTPESDTVCGLLPALSVIVKVPVRVPSAVGVKVTSILQFCFAASVAPQGFVLVPCAKSPEVAMLEMLSVEVPVFVSVTAFPGLVASMITVPQVSEVGDTVTVGPTLETVKVTVVVDVMVPDTPVIVTVVVPTVAVALAVKVSVLVVVAGFGLNAAVTPFGRVEVLKVTLPLKAFCGVIVIALVPVPPCSTPTELGLAAKVKPGPGITFTTI
jgi:hypothetical protein